QDQLVDALYALVDKLDEMTDVYGYEDYTYDDHDNDEIPEESEEEEEEEYEEEKSPLESKIDKLCDAIASLATIVADQAKQPVIVAAAPAPVPAQEPEEPAPAVEPEKEEEPAAQEPAPVEAPAVEPQVIEKVVEVEKPVEVEKIVEVPVEKEVDKVLNDADSSDPIQRAKIEYESAKDGSYDISFAFTDASLEDVQLSLGDYADSYLVNGKTVIIIPFLDKNEAKEELDKIGAPYDVTTVLADDNVDFDKSIAPKFA
ncbi:MAG: hypothetical protein IJ863_05545, partial [Spirochaetales bacterium]|nr:hypothetical protein [Spirochaetales bacterium]